MLTHVFTLKATGNDAVTHVFKRILTTSACYATHKVAASRVESFRTTLLKGMMIDPIKIEIIPHEVIYD